MDAFSHFFVKDPRRSCNRSKSLLVELEMLPTFLSMLESCRRMSSIVQLGLLVRPFKSIMNKLY
jgi:hypothetical protein